MKSLLVFWKRRGTAARVAIVFLVLCVINWTRIAITGNGVRLTTEQPKSAELGQHTLSGQRVGGPITMASYQQLQTGMSYQEAKSILGADGVEMSSNDIGGTRTVMYQWKGQGMANMNAMFQDDKLVSKAQFGLD